ncbi:GAF domain-containing protein [Anopheles sinensis]|uniref:GAF domain-containing protein n=1 Tax=Anopheles sinensis TaxID=74873 RepID=A0A084WTQ5_ANOSI|nr:GAF domain-containing protein [Anopheles sinensis]
MVVSPHYYHHLVALLPIATRTRFPKEAQAHKMKIIIKVHFINSRFGKTKTREAGAGHRTRQVPVQVGVCVVMAELPHKCVREKEDEEERCGIGMEWGLVDSIAPFPHTFACYGNNLTDSTLFYARATDRSLFVFRQRPQKGPFRCGPWRGPLECTAFPAGRSVCTGSQIG